MRIGEFIKYKRQQLGFSQQQLADLLGISKQAIGKWEKCTAMPDVMIISDVACSLRVKPEFLMQIIWIGETGELVDHYISIDVTESDGLNYMIKGYKSAEFLSIKDAYEEICAGKNEQVMKLLEEYYEYDSRRTFEVTFWEGVNKEGEEELVKTLVIESRKLDLLMKKEK